MDSSLVVFAAGTLALLLGPLLAAYSLFVLLASWGAGAAVAALRSSVRRGWRTQRRVFNGGFIALNLLPWAPLLERLFVRARRILFAPAHATSVRYVQLAARRNGQGGVAAICCNLTSSGALPPVPAGHVRIVMVSDTHGRHRLLRLPKGHLLVHVGDILMRNGSGCGAARALADFNAWLGAQPFTHKVVIGGNHDALLEALGPQAAQRLLSHAVYLDRAAAELEVHPEASPGCGGAGAEPSKPVVVRVWGFGWSPLSPSSNSAWQLLPDEEVVEAFRSIPDGVHLVVTHSDRHAALQQVVRRARPVIHACGHFHEGNGVELREGTLWANASICDRMFRALLPSVVVDVPANALS